MKKILSLVAAILIVGSLNSCKPREKCPAYGYHAAPASKTIHS